MVVVEEPTSEPLADREKPQRFLTSGEWRIWSEIILNILDGTTRANKNDANSYYLLSKPLFMCSTAKKPSKSSAA